MLILKMGGASKIKATRPHTAFDLGLLNAPLQRRESQGGDGSIPFRMHIGIALNFVECTTLG